jgi:hypothetical protein
MSAEETFPHFETIYNELTNLIKVVIGKGPFPAARSEPQAYATGFSETIKREFSEFSRRGPVNQLNFPASGTGRSLSAVRKFRNRAINDDTATFLLYFTGGSLLGCTRNLMKVFVECRK